MLNKDYYEAKISENWTSMM